MPCKPKNDGCLGFILLKFMDQNSFGQVDLENWGRFRWPCRFSWKNMKSFEMFRMLSSCHSGVWRGILSVMDAFDLNIRFRVGSG